MAVSGQIIDASIVAAPQRHTDGEKRDIKEARIPPRRGRARLRAVRRLTRSAPVRA
jgi:hypothetical protein